MNKPGRKKACVGKKVSCAEKVFILFGENPRDGVAGTFTTRKAAQDQAEAWKKAGEPGWLEYSIEESEVAS